MNNIDKSMLRLDIPEILWHGEYSRIMSIDFHPFMDFLVSGG